MNKEKFILSLGILNFLLPFGLIYNIIILFLVLLFNLKHTNINKISILKFFLYLFIFFSTLQGYVSLNLVLSILVFDYLHKRDKYTETALLLIILETSLLQNTVSFLLSNINYSYIGFLIPNILLLFLFFLLSVKIFHIFFSLTLLVTLNYVLFTLDILVLYSAIITSLVTLSYLLFNIDKKKSEKIISNSTFLILSVFSLVLFLQFNIGSKKDFFYFLPENLEAYEAKFFKNYSQALKFSNKDFKELNSIEDLKDNSLVLLPWVSDLDKNFINMLQQIKDSKKKLTIIIAGEHTNHQGSQKTINELVGKDILNNDLTVPRRNSDNSGFVRSIDFREWPSKSILNRGASTYPGLFDKTLLTGDLWFSEPNINEWLWVGDYNWQPSEKIGRLPLATITNKKNLTFLIFGDNSFLMNFQIIANPTPLMRVINMSTIIPLIINDFIIFLLIIFFIFNYKFGLIIAVTTSFYSLFSLTNNNSNIWNDFYMYQSGFDENNFNKHYLDISKDLEDYSIVRTPYLREETLIEKNNAIIFSLIDAQFNIKDLQINDCFRAGSLNYKKIRIMDGQFCKVKGNYKKIIGDDNRSFVFLYSYKEFNKIVILDRNFLSTKAPFFNVNFIKELLMKLK